METAWKKKVATVIGSMIPSGLFIETPNGKRMANKPIISHQLTQLFGLRFYGLKWRKNNILRGISDTPQLSHIKHQQAHRPLAFALLFFYRVGTV